jgi:hypothetical protein
MQETAMNTPTTRPTCKDLERAADGGDPEQERGEGVRERFEIVGLRMSWMDTDCKE